MSKNPLLRLVPPFTLTTAKLFENPALSALWASACVMQAKNSREVANRKVKIMSYKESNLMYSSGSENRKALSRHN